MGKERAEIKGWERRRRRREDWVSRERRDKRMRKEGDKRELGKQRNEKES